MPKTMIDASKFEAIILASGLPMTPQKGFVKVSGAKGRNVYVAATKTVGRVDLSGFTVEGEMFVEPHCGVFGNVHQQLDFEGRPEAEILMDFAWLLEHMKSLPAAEQTRKAPAKRQAKEGDAKGWTTIPAKPRRSEQPAQAPKAASSPKGEKGKKAAA